MYLFIDNCSLIQLVQTDAYSQYLMRLTNFIKASDVKMITHKLILDEWKKHKLLDVDRRVKKLKKIHRRAHRVSELLPSYISIEHINVQYETIDQLLENAIVVETPEIIRGEFSDRYRNRLAPFHNKRDSQNDWEAFGSIAHYCNMNGISSLYFISANYGEFADPTNNNSLHTDLVKRFKPLNVHYFKEVDVFLQLQVTSIFPKELLLHNIVRNEKFSYKAAMCKHMLDSLYTLFKKVYSEVEFVPLHILKRYYPFKDKESDYNHYSIYNLYNVPDELIAIFKAIEIDESIIKITNLELFEGINLVEEKLDFVLMRMNRNLIFSMTDKNSQRINIEYSVDKTCSCLNCTFLTLQWGKSIMLLQDEAGCPEEELRQAFIHYQFGNYDKATEIYLKLRDLFKKFNKYILYFICQYNLRHLSFFLSGFSYNSNYSTDEINTLKEIDPIEESVKLKQHTDYDLLPIL